MSASPVEIATVRAFVIPHRRTRWIWGLGRSEKRGRILDRLNHCRDLDARYMHAVLPSQSHPRDLAAALRDLGAPDVCHVISGLSDIDGREVDLDLALEAVANSWIRTILSCIPGHLAYYEGEELSARRILSR